MIDRRHAAAGLVVSLAAVVLLTLTPMGEGWDWADPGEELLWYLSDLGSPRTVLQWAGNALLLAAPAAFVVIRWPRLQRPAALAVASVAAAACIEVLQRLLPLGRVVSPLDAALNAFGAVVAGLVAAQAQQVGRATCSPPGHALTDCNTLARKSVTGAARPDTSSRLSSFRRSVGP